MITLLRFKYLLAIGLFLPVISFSQAKDVVIHIIQDQQTIPLNDFETNIVFKKKGFKIQVMLKNIEGVYVFASVKDSVYRFSEKDPIYDFVYLPMLEIKEDKYNVERELNISETGWSKWFYDPKADWYTFSRKVYELDSEKVVCTKVIKQLYDVAEGTQVKLKDVDGPLYLFFVAVAEYDSNGKPSKELIRRKVKIDWKDDDD